MTECNCPAAGLVSAEDTVGVIGSSHSAILVLMNLLEMEQWPRVVNLYRSRLKYAKFLSDGTIILDNTGLKVNTGTWCLLKRAHAQLIAGCHRHAPSHDSVQPQCAVWEHKNGRLWRSGERLQ